jgi:aminoglycoside phosphotransferase (APT) family kinase protein
MSTPDSVSTAPPARGVRLPWRQVPAELREAIERTVGSPITGVTERTGGFSPGIAARLELSDGTSRFVKATSAELNPDSYRIYQMEAEIAGALPAGVPAPRLLDQLTVGSWIGLLFEYVPGRPPREPWDERELRTVLDLIAELPDLLAADSVPAPTVVEQFSTAFQGWRRVAGEQLAGRLPHGDWIGRNLAALVELEVNWADAAAGDSLVHADLRADNLLLDRNRVWVLDWPWACRAQPWFDLLGMLPSVLMQGGPPAEQIVAEHPVFAGVEPAAVTAVLAALIGFFLRQSLQPPPPGLPTLRAFQLGQGAAGLPWLMERTGWR